MSDLQANIYVTVSIDRVKVTLDKLHKFYYVLEYKDQKFNSSENPVKTQEIQWTDLRFTFKLDENEAKTASFKFQLWGPATKLKRSDFIIAEANVSFKDFLAKHALNFEPVEREPQYNFESVFIRKGKEHGSLLFSAEVTGWKVIDDMLKSEEDHTRECAFQNFKLLSTTKNPKLNQYIRAETFQTINDAIKRSIKSSKKVKSPRKDTEKLIAEEKPASGKDENKNDMRKAFLELWEMLCKIDVNMRNKLISLGALQAIKKFIKCSDIEVQLHFLEMLKQFFTLAAHQKEIIKEGLLKKLISLVTVDELRVQMKAFEILLYFDEVHQPEMIRLGLVGKLISLLKHSNPSVQAKALEIIQYFDAKHQDLLISTGALKELTDLIKLDPKDAFTHGLILKTLSVISHFDVPHQREILEQQMHIPLLELLKLDSEKIKLKTLSVIEGFDPSYEQNFMDAGLLQFINILLDDERISIKTKAFETVTKLKHHTTEIIEVGILDRLLNLMNDSNTVLQMNAFEFVQKFPATQQQLIDAGVLKNVKLVLQSPLSASSVIISAALEFLITFEATYYKQIIAAGIVESVLAIMSQKITWTVVPYNKILNFCLKVLELYKADYEDEIVSKNAFNVFLDMLKPTGQRLDETIVFDFMTSFKKWRQHLKPVLSAFFPLLIDSRDKVRKGVISVIEKYPAEEHGDLMKAGLFDVLLSSFLVANQNQIVAQSFFTLMTSLKNYQEELFKSRARYDKLITIAKLNEFKRTNILDLFSKLEDSIKPKVLKYNLIGHLLEFAAVAPSSSKYSGAKLLDMITEFDGWKEALLELKALKNLTDFLNNPAKALQIKAMDLLEEFSTEKQVAMMQDGLVQALLQTVVINEDEGVQSRALDYLFNISNNPTFMEILCTSKDGSIIDGFAVRMDKSTAHPSIIIEDGGTKLTIDATKQNYANWCTCYGIEPMTKGVKCWEMVIDSPNMNNFMVGVCTKNQRNTEYLGQNVNGWSMYYSSGSIYFYHGGNSQLHKTERLNKGDTIGLIYDAENGQLEMYVKDEYVGIVYGAITGDVYPAVSLYNNTDAVTFRAAPQLAVKRESVAKEEQSAMNPIEAEVVNQWIGTSAQWFLAYRASVHGWHTRNFHSRCDFKGPTITIVRTPDAVFGGYSSMPWASTGGYKRDNNAFLFSLTNPHNLPPSKHQLYRNQQNSVYHDVSTYKMNFQANIAQASSGPTFGGGFDMYINLSNKEASYSNLGFSYQNANPNPPGLNAAHYFTGRNSQWNITDVEVYLQHKPKRMQRKLLLYQFVRTIEIVKPHTAKKFKEILFSIAGKKPVYKKYLLAVVQKILSEPGLLKPMQVTMEELKAGFGASGIELLSYRVVSVNGKKEPPAKDLSKQDGKYLESETPALEIVLEVLPRKSNNTDESNDSNNNNTNTNVMPADEELPYITHLLVSAPIKQALDKFSAAKDIVCFLSNDELEPTQLAKFNEIKFDDPSFEYKELLELKAEKTTDKATTNDCLLDFDEKQEDTVGANNNNVVEDKNDEELKALKKFLREVKLGVHKPTPPPQEVQTNQYGYVFVNEANERVRYKDEAMVDLSQFANGVITYRVEYLENGNIEWLADSTAVEDVIEVPPRPKKEVKDEAKEREEKERIEKLERELEEKEREEKERKERELKERGEHLNKTPEEREKDRIAAILADLRHDTEDDAETQTLQKIEEPYKPVAVIDLDSLAEKPLKQATMARYVTVKVLRPTKANTCTTLSHIALVGFFKSANKQPLPPPTTMMDISRRFGFVKEGIKMFNYASNGDTNGVLYWIGTQDGKSSTWGNPAESKRVTVTTSHPMFNTWMKPELILDRGSIINYWGSDLPIHFTLDMQNYEVYITHFTIRHAHNQAYGFIQNFGLAGSKDGDTWVQLFSQESSPFEKPHDWVTLTVPEGQDFYRYFRLTQRTSYKDSPNFTGGPFMFISGFELYGTMRYFN